MALSLYPIVRVRYPTWDPLASAECVAFLIARASGTGVWAVGDMFARVRPTVAPSRGAAEKFAGSAGAPETPPRPDALPRGTRRPRLGATAGRVRGNLGPATGDRTAGGRPARTERTPCTKPVASSNAPTARTRASRNISCIALHEIKVKIRTSTANGSYWGARPRFRLCASKRGAGNPGRIRPRPNNTQRPAHRRRIALHQRPTCQLVVPTATAPVVSGMADRTSR